MAANSTSRAFAARSALSPRTLAAVLVTVSTWGSAFAGIRAGLTAYTPAHLALLRYLIASLALAVYALVTHMPLPARRDLPRVALLGFLGIAFYNLALNFGEETVASGTASLIIASVPIWMALLGSLLFRERLRLPGWLGIALSFAGVAVIALGNQGGLKVDPRAVVILIAAISSSLYSLGQKPLLTRYGALQCTAYAIWAGAILLLPFGLRLPAAVSTAPLGATGAISYLGIVPGALGYCTWAYILARVPAATAGSFLYLVPAFAMLIAWLWLGEVPTLLSLGGGLLVLAGVIVVNSWGRGQR